MWVQVLGSILMNDLLNTFEHYYEYMRLSGKIDNLWNKFSKEEQQSIKVLATEVKVQSLIKKENIK